MRPEPRAAPPPRARRPAHTARPHQQPVAGVALEVLLPADGAIVLTCGKEERKEDVEVAPQPVGPLCSQARAAGPR